jgi:methyl-accepting chemotaxis protein
VVEIVGDSVGRAEQTLASVDRARDAFVEIGARVDDVRARIEPIGEATNEIAALAADAPVDDAPRSLRLAS